MKYSIAGDSPPPGPLPRDDRYPSERETSTREAYNMSFLCCHSGTIFIIYMISLIACVADVHLYHMGSWGAKHRASGRAPTAPVGRYGVLFHVFQGSTPRQS